MSRTPRIVVDPGHGGMNGIGHSSPVGVRGPRGILEKDVNLEIARQVVARLGGSATLTRAGDENLTLAARSAFAARENADVFVSIHANGGQHQGRGAETFFHPGSGENSRSLAASVQQALDLLDGRYGGSSGPREGAMAVLDPGRLGRDTAACLVEVDYLSDPHGERRLGDRNERAAIGGAIAGAIRSHVERRGRLGRGRAEAAALVEPNIDYSATSLDDANRAWQDLLTRYGEWMQGVPDRSLFYFPHAAICQLTLNDASDNVAYGTGFYIGQEKILTCGHNFADSDGWVTTRVTVAPGYSPRASTLATAVYDVNGTDLVHPRWRGSYDPTHDLAVLRVPGLPAQAGWFELAIRSLGADEGIVVCGYGKVDGAGPYADQGQRMDGAHIGAADTEMVYYPIHTIGGHSGSPVFHQGTVIAVHTGPRMLASGRASAHENRGVLLNPDKSDWVHSR